MHRWHLLMPCFGWRLEVEAFPIHFSYQRHLQNIDMRLRYFFKHDDRILKCPLKIQSCGDNLPGCEMRRHLTRDRGGSCIRATVNGTALKDEPMCEAWERSKSNRLWASSHLRSSHKLWRLLFWIDIVYVCFPYYPFVFFWFFAYKSCFNAKKKSMKRRRRNVWIVSYNWGLINIHLSKILRHLVNSSFHKAAK